MAKATVETGQCIRAIVYNAVYELGLDLSSLRSTEDICDGKTLHGRSKKIKRKANMIIRDEEVFGVRGTSERHRNEQAQGRDTCKNSRQLDPWSTELLPWNRSCPRYVSPTVPSHDKSSPALDGSRR